MTAKEACEAIEKGLKNIDTDAQIVKVPMADGGEGTVQALVDALNGKIITKKVTGPLNKPVTAFYGLIEQKRLAVIEMSAASGIQFVNHDTADPLHATTYGTGELILDALQLRAMLVWLRFNPASRMISRYLVIMMTSFVMNLRCKAYEFIIKETVPSDRNLGIRFPESRYRLKRNSGTVAPERRFRIARNTQSAKR